MTKIDEVIRRASTGNLAPMQRTVLQELEKRPDEVFTVGDPSFAQVFPKMNKNGIDWSLWALHKKGLIGKHKVKGDRTYYGSHAAVSELKKRLEGDSRKTA